MNKETYYGDRKNISWLKIAIIVVILVIIGILIFMMLKNNTNLYEEITNVSKKYASATNDYPEEIGDCRTYTLDRIIANETSSKQKVFSTCDKTKTTVKVCKVGENKYQYTPVLSCKRETTSFNEWKTGTIDNLISDNSDVQILFTAEAAKNGAKVYYPNNEADSTNVKEYYAQSPNAEYALPDNETTAYKWYVEGQAKVYYNNGEYTSSQPAGYTSENEKTNTYTTIVKPATAAFRTIVETTLYATEKVSYPYKYDCSDIASAEPLAGTVTSPIPCELRTDEHYKTTVGMHYTCDGTNEAASGAVCEKRSNWSTTSCEESNQTRKGTTSEGYDFSRNVSNGYTCVKATGYTVTDRTWKWYKVVNTRKYYPSNATSASQENTYYVDAPIAGAIKDSSTEAKVYQYYKLDETNNTVKNWVSVSDEAMTKDELIKTLKELEYDVNSIADIDNNEDIRYTIVIKYRNRK
ncbi:MAG: hypothetical protein IJ565_03860 [Bacilli bacterium]|nr:hypothetical protein [Bacilli bacterium]